MSEALTTSYFIWKNNEQSGPFTITQLRGMWQNGVITGEMLYFQEGMSDWTPLSNIINLLESKPEPQKVVLAKQEPMHMAVETAIEGIKFLLEDGKRHKLEKGGRLTIIGMVGIVLGILFIGVAVATVFSGDKIKEESDMIPVLVMGFMGVFFIVASWFYARK